MIKEIGMSFSTRLILPVLSGMKTQTRRPMKHEKSQVIGPKSDEPFVPFGVCESFPREEKKEWWDVYDGIGREKRVRCRYPVGTIFYIKETYTIHRGEVVYRADPGAPEDVTWRSLRFMPKKVARPDRFIITDVRGQFIQDITESDALAEGIHFRLLFGEKDPVPFPQLWNMTYGEGAWERNDLVFAYTFERWKGEE